jgi:hypothetical protein
MAVSDGEMNVSPGARRAIEGAVGLLSPFDSEPRVGALISKLTTIANPEGSTDDDDEDRIEKALEGVHETLAKSEDLPPQTRDRLRKAAVDLERESVARVNPRGADAWGRLHRHDLGAA